ncbi:ABC transporter permease subunit [Limnoglobus roseus]|uniref:ABC transporter permease n=1 Tax=Limnoglobus roseus TaxID=2598579 RepID=A0A5C1A6C5_9BACT|nr:ABC transporter permease subunit [Limnoglobus roseus]QEL14711.1 ABC transporter permease [Limnoglobus roseus]
MPTITLPFVLGLTGFFLAVLTVLPGLALKVVAFVRRRESPAVLGPLFWDELVRVTRRGAHLRLRTAYSLFLLVSLLVAYLGEFREVNPIRLLFGPGEEFPRERVTAFAETFFHVFLFCQLIALTIVTPVFAGGSITEEKDRGTLAFLQTSLLTNREIVLGKLAARVVFVLGLSLTGLPVLALTLLFGGVDPDILVTSFVAAVMSTVSLAALSFWLATGKETLKEVLVLAYIRVPFWFAVGSCFSFSNPIFMSLLPSPFVFTLFSIQGNGPTFDLMGLSAIFVCVHGLLAMVYAILAMGNIRAADMRFVEQQREGPYTTRIPTLSELTEEPYRPRYVPVVEGVRRERPPPRLRRIPYLHDDDPFVWKETYFGGSALRFEADLMGCVTGLLVATLIPLAFGIFIALLSSDRPGEVLNGLFRIASVSLGAFLIPLAGVRATGCVSRERQRQTLDSMLTLPVDRVEFLRAKWRAAFRWLVKWLIGFAAFTAVTTLFLSVSFPGVLLSLLALGAAVMFFLTLAVWLSVRCATVVRATTWFLGITFAAFLLPPMVAVLVRGAVQILGGSARLFDAATTSLSLPFALEAVAAPLPADGRFTESWAGAAAATLALTGAFLGLAALLWRDAVRRFEDEGR